MISMGRSRKLLGVASGLVVLAGAMVAWSPAPRAAAGELDCDTALLAWSQTVAAYYECLGVYDEEWCDANVPLDYARSQAEAYCGFHWE